MKRKRLAALICIALTAAMLAGCGSGSTSEANGKAAGSGTAKANKMEVKGDDVTVLEVWTFIEMHQDFYVNMAEKWNEENPEKKIKLVMSNLAYDDMHNKLSLTLESGEGAPDVADIELGKFPSFMIGDVQLMDLTGAMKPYEATTVESRLDIYSKNGERYGFPTHVGATVVFYNTALLESAGIDYRAIKTWDDFKEAGVAYFENTGKYFSCIETSAQWMLNLMLAQKGGDYLDSDGELLITRDEMAEVLEYIKAMQATGAFETIPGGQPDNEEAYPRYNIGDYAVQIMPFWQTSRFVNYMADLSGNVAIAKPPVFKEGDLQSIGGGGTGTAVIKTGKHAELAAEVFAYIKLSGTANEEVWNVLGFDPVNTEVWSDTDLTRNPNNPYVQFFNTYPFDTLIEIQDGIGSLGSLTNEKWPSINHEFCTNTLNNIFESGMDVRKALADSYATLENEFE